MPTNARRGLALLASLVLPVTTVRGQAPVVTDRPMLMVPARQETRAALDHREARKLYGL